MNPLNNPRVNILESCPNISYDVFIDNKLMFLIKRQPQSPFLWQVISVSTDAIIDVNQYRYDLFEHIATYFPAQ